MNRSMRFLMIVNDPAIARFCSENGVGRLFVDLEQLGKAERQKHVESWKSGQTPEDVTRVREAAPDAHLLVRLNPWHEGSGAEIEDALKRGADSLMLPMFRTVSEVARFQDRVAGRAEVVPLFETAASLEILPQLLDEVPLRDVHIGLNDLHLDLGQRFIFEPLARGLLDEPCKVLREHGVTFGIGGLARAGEGIVPPEIVIGEHVRLGSDAAILSRSFHRNATSLEGLLSNTDFVAEIAQLQSIYREFLAADAAALQANRQRLVDRVVDIVHVIEQG